MGIKSAVIGFIVAGLLATASPAQGQMQTQIERQNLGSELTRFLYDDATATLHFRSFYLDRTNPQPPSQAAWAGGGWVGYQSGWLYGILRVGGEGWRQPLQYLAGRAAAKAVG